MTSQGQKQVPVRIALIDDHTLFRESLRRLLEGDDRYRVVAEASTLQQGINLMMSNTAFDIAMVDFDLGADDRRQSGLAVLRSMRQHRPKMPCMLVTAGIDAPEIEEAIQTLHASVFLKSEPAAELLLALEKTMRGELWISSQASLRLMNNRKVEEPVSDSPGAMFSPRELLVLSYITQGLSNKEIAGKLDLTESSVKAMLQKLFAKTSVRSRSQLVRYVFESEMELP